mmetsp:Transcript_28058/g.43649  ORF Transcript_28058/g.43649 Transcript_28058/m.43649 type:complete len:591 (-) Transcript_28058:1293-3065(-)|eukprot:CAMPEP_0196828534 /NCGR_PEP_ID=MMETSP1362-20130617/94728_1 /TAXON_ID=163516 /ORGANISM="Leptocylindrus danicus, Strain CCMP1856" /LENGTH=590 /DNA_ID=CAMNT_0042209215 /DNA_START=46 /DNA_END=1818 /DNA_ORIENTATION=+
MQWLLLLFICSTSEAFQLTWNGDSATTIAGGVLRNSKLARSRGEESRRIRYQHEIYRHYPRWTVDQYQRQYRILHVLDSSNGSDHNEQVATNGSTDNVTSSTATVEVDVEGELKSLVNPRRSSTIRSKFQTIRDKERSMRKKSLSLAKNIVYRPVKEAASVLPRPDAIAGILFDAAEGSAEEVGKAWAANRSNQQEKLLQRIETATNPADQIAAVEATALEMIAETKAIAEAAIAAAEVSAQQTISNIKTDSVGTILSIEVTASEAVAAIRADAAKAGVDIGATSVSASSSVTQECARTDNLLTQEACQEERVFSEEEIESLSLADVDFTFTEMAPPFIDEDQCLIPGEAIVRVEKAPDNSRRIFAGIDIMANVEDVWKVLTDYSNLQDVVPNLVKNDVLELYDGDASFSADEILGSSGLSDEEKLERISVKMKGAKLKQVGGAKVVGINFSARTTLEVREWPNGMPDLGHFDDEVYQGKTREKRAKEEKMLPLKRYHFPRPFAVCTLPHKDISMQSVNKDDGEFRMYQGVWRMQPLPGCAPEGGSAMRLTYAVEISPKAFLPVGLIENRIAMDLCANLRSIRDFVQVEN